MQLLFKFPFVTNIEEERKVMNDERREHGAADESCLEQQIHESDNNTLIVSKNRSPSTSGTRSYVRQAGRLSDENLVYTYVV